MNNRLKNQKKSTRFIQKMTGIFLDFQLISGQNDYLLKSLIVTFLIILPWFQAFSMFRAKLGEKTEEEIEILKNNPTIWNVHSVLNVLHSLVDKSNINQQLRVYNFQEAGVDLDEAAGEFGRHSLYKVRQITWNSSYKMYTKKVLFLMYPITV